MIDSLTQYGGNIDAIFFCPHNPDDSCECRKPKPGLIYEIRDRFKVNLSHVKFIGDSYRDLLAAKKAGAIPWLVRTGNGNKTIEEHKKGANQLPSNTEIFLDLSDAVKNILR